LILFFDIYHWDSIFQQPSNHLLPHSAFILSFPNLLSRRQKVYQTSSEHAWSSMDVFNNLVSVFIVAEDWKILFGELLASSMKALMHSNISFFLFWQQIEVSIMWKWNIARYFHHWIINRCNSLWDETFSLLLLQVSQARFLIFPSGQMHLNNLIHSWSFPILIFARACMLLWEEIVLIIILGRRMCIAHMWKYEISSSSYGKLTSSRIPIRD
jgi:hypothetical protein